MSFVDSVTSDGKVGTLALDPAEATRLIVDALRDQVGETLKRRGLVVGMSGGVDSSLCAALAVRALGPKRVFGLFMPEHDSDPTSLALATSLARQLEIESVVEDIAPTLEACGCYRRRDEAIRRLVPDFGDKYAAYAVEKTKRSGATDAQVAAKTREMTELNQMLKKPLVNIALTFVEPLPVGILFTLITAVALSRKRRVQGAAMA